MALCNTNTQRSEQKLEAVKAYWGVQHCREWTLNAAAANSSWFGLNYINESHEEVLGYVWLNEGGLGTDPTPAGKTLVAGVAVTDLTDAAGTAAEIAAALDALDFLKAESVDDVLEVLNVFIGIITAEVDGDTTYTLSVGQTGVGGYLGSIASGGASLSRETTYLDITDDQSGSVIKDRIIQGTSDTIEMSLLELTKARWEYLIGDVTGGKIVIGLDTIIGDGTSKLYQSIFNYAGRLVLHPVRLPDSDRSLDLVFHKTAPEMASLNFSGQDVQGAEMSFLALQDTAIDTRVNIMSYGDYTLL